MIKNYILVALRNLWRNRSFSLINIGGLAISMSICLMAISMIVENYSYDNFQRNAEKVYRVNHREKVFFGQVLTMASAPHSIGKAIKEQVADVEDVVMLKSFRGELKAAGKSLPSSGLYANQSFFNVFTFDYDHIDLSKALTDPFAIVLTASEAKRYFGDDDPRSQTISITDVGEFTVTGVIPDPPTASHIQFQFLASLPTLTSIENKNPVSTDPREAMVNNYVYVMMKDGKDTTGLSALVSSFASQNYLDAETMNLKFQLQHFSEIAPSSEDISNEMSRVPRVELAFFLFGITLVIMISAGFNYTNLSIARSLTRAREVGIRKTSGALRRHVFYQFIIEAMVLSLFSLMLAMAVLEFLKTSFLDLLGPLNQVQFSNSIAVYVLFVLFALLVGFCAGFLPASILSRLDPVKVLKDLSGLRVISGLGLRKALILFQFVLSILFIVTASVIQKQFEFATSKNLGFEKEHILNIDLKGNDYSKALQVFSQLKDVRNISASSAVPGTHWWAATTLQKSNSDSIDLKYIAIDQEFISNLELQWIAGSNFPIDASMQHEQFIILNERAVAWLGYTSPKQILGKSVRIDGADLEVIGVIKDFHYWPIDSRERIGPFAFRYKPSEFNFVNIKWQAQDFEKTIGEMERLWKTIDPEHPFTYHFYEDQLNSVLNGYRIMKGITKFVSFLAISLACLGLLGMTIYTLHTRKKEIAIRRVLGASSVNLVASLSKSFVINLMTATLFALPLAYLLNKLWLDRVNYKMQLQLDFMIADVLIILAIGIGIVVSQTYKASQTDPASTLQQ